MTPYENHHSEDISHFLKNALDLESTINSESAPETSLPDFRIWITEKSRKSAEWKIAR